jgi:hypothetical protein
MLCPKNGSSANMTPSLPGLNASNSNSVHLLTIIHFDPPTKCAIILKISATAVFFGAVAYHGIYEETRQAWLTKQVSDWVDKTANKERAFVEPLCPQ